MRTSARPPASNRNKCRLHRAPARGRQLHHHRAAARSRALASFNELVDSGAGASSQCATQTSRDSGARTQPRCTDGVTVFGVCTHMCVFAALARAIAARNHARVRVWPRQPVLINYFRTSKPLILHHNVNPAPARRRASIAHRRHVCVAACVCVQCLRRTHTIIPSLLWCTHQQHSADTMRTCGNARARARALAWTPVRSG